MNADTIVQFIDIIPTVIMYFAPYLAFIFFYKLNSHKHYKINLISFEAIVISFILKLLIGQIAKWILGYMIYDLWIIIWSAISGLVIGLVVSNQYFDYWFGKIFHRTVDDSVWYGIQDTKYGCYVDVFLSNGVIYHGTYFKNYTDSSGTWIVLSGFEGECSGQKLKKFNEDKKDDFQAVINVNKIEHMQVQYQKDSIKNR